MSSANSQGHDALSVLKRAMKRVIIEMYCFGRHRSTGGDGAMNRVTRTGDVRTQRTNDGSIQRHNVSTSDAAGVVAWKRFDSSYHELNGRKVK